MHALLHSVPPTLQQATTDPHLHQRLLDTHRQVWVSLLWGHCSFLLGQVHIRFCLCPPRVCFPIYLAWSDGTSDEIPVDVFQILKDDAGKVLHSICQQIWKTQQWPQVCKRSVFIPIPKKGNAKECSNYRTIALIWHASKVMLKILQARLQQYMNCELPHVQAGFRKGGGTRDQITNIFGSWKKQESSRKTSTSALSTMTKPFTV